MTDDQRQRLAIPLKRLREIIGIAFDMSVADARGFVEDFNVTFHGAGWQTHTSAVLAPGNRPPREIGLIVPDLTSLSPKQTLIIESVDAVGMQFDVQRGDPSFGASRVSRMSFARPTPNAAILIAQPSNERRVTISAPPPNPPEPLPNR